MVDSKENYIFDLGVKGLTKKGEKTQYYLWLATTDAV